MEDKYIIAMYNSLEEASEHLVESNYRYNNHKLTMEVSTPIESTVTRYCVVIDRAKGFEDH